MLHSVRAALEAQAAAQSEVGKLKEEIAAMQVEIASPPAAATADGAASPGAPGASQAPSTVAGGDHGPCIPRKAEPLVATCTRQRTRRGSAPMLIPTVGGPTSAALCGITGGAPRIAGACIAEAVAIADRAVDLVEGWQ